MCLAIPGRVTELCDETRMAQVDVLGVQRKVSVDLLRADPPTQGDWVLIHVGFAMSKISEQQAKEQIEVLEMLGELAEAQEEVRGYRAGADAAAAGSSPEAGSA